MNPISFGRCRRWTDSAEAVRQLAACDPSARDTHVSRASTDGAPSVASASHLHVKDFLLNDAQNLPLHCSVELASAAFASQIFTANLNLFGFAGPILLTSAILRVPGSMFGVKNFCKDKISIQSKVC